jgi:molybdenum cofactor cytidylyltransferase
MANNIAAILLAAGLSSRMGQPKLLLPWGGTTVLGQVVSTFSSAGVEEIIVVTGGAREQVEQMVARLAVDFPVRAVFNPEYKHGEMLSSIQAGLAALDGKSCAAAMIGLGDQPQIQKETVQHICSVFLLSGSPLVIPSFQNHRGHPWLAATPLWSEILALPFSTTPRHFLNAHSDQVEYVPADQSILLDLDTPEDYARQRP